MATPLITTIIPTFRRPKVLKRAIESVLAQSFKDFKLCIYDNASGDETEEIVAEYICRDARVCYVKNSQNIGALKNMIQGVEAVSTEFYTLLNDDDFILPGFYEEAIGVLQNYPKVGFVCAKTITVDLINNTIHYRNKDWLPGVYEPSNVVTFKMYKSHFTQTGVILRRRMREAIGPFESSGNDMLYMTMAAASSPFVVLNGYSGVYMIHKGAYSTMKGIVGENSFDLYRALLSTVDRITKLELRADMKGHLLALVTNTYFGLLEAKELNQLTCNYDTWQMSMDTHVPSRITKPGLIIKLYKYVPKGLHKVFIFVVREIRHVKQYINKNAKVTMNSDVIALSKDLRRVCVGHDSDVSLFGSWVRERDTQSTKVQKRPSFRHY